jgi:serine/threonine protein kinase
MECNEGQGLKLTPGVVACDQDHEAIVYLLEPGDVVGDFKVDEVLPAGEGGYSTVYRATPHVEGYPPSVALKVALSNRRGALELEAAVLSYLQNAHSPNVPRIYPIPREHQAPMPSAGPDATNPYLGSVVLDLEPFYYLAIEFLPGGSLRDKLEAKGGRSLGVQQTLDTIRTIGQALRLLHSRGHIHLDVKPANIMYNMAGEAVLIDYGITVREDGDETSWPGTAPYAPREQINQDYPDHRADIHALGVTAFEMLTGVLPYRGASANALATSILASKPFTLAQVAPRLAHLDPALRPALSPYPDERYPTVEAFVSAMEEAVQKKDVGSGSRARFAVAGVMALVAVLAIVGIFLVASTQP